MNEKKELVINASDVFERKQTVSENTVQAHPHQHPRNDRFLVALEQFERALETPIISGDLSEWLAVVHESFQQVRELYRDDIRETHADLYARILRQDLELASQIGKLQTVDMRLAKQELQKLESAIETLSAINAASEIKEMPSLEAFVKQALTFVIDARTQETAIATWFMEAFNRDSGSGD